MLVPRDRLPEDPIARHAALRDYFCDKDAEALMTHEGWQLSLAWPDGLERHVDPRLDEGLNWWGEGLQRGGMATARRREGRILSTLYDSWTLHGWSEWLARSKGDARNVVVLHVDDHRDLGSPRLAADGSEGWRDLISGAKVSLNQPASVAAAIESGAIGMGSFMTPFLHAMPTAEVRHLCQPPKTTATSDFRIEPAFEQDALLDPSARRPAVRLDPAQGETGPGRYRTTASTRDWLAGIGAGPILVHIDMDYFNNRYDGDSDWAGRPKAFDRSIETVVEQADAIGRAVATAGLGPRIADITIAFSPGFFPAELWRESAERLVAAIDDGH